MDGLDFEAEVVAVLKPALLDRSNGPVRAKSTALRYPSRPDHAKVQIFQALGLNLRNAVGHKEHGGNPELHRDLRSRFEDFFIHPWG